jgi:hypothetical protein
MSPLATAKVGNTLQALLPPHVFDKYLPSVIAQVKQPEWFGCAPTYVRVWVQDKFIGSVPHYLLGKESVLAASVVAMRSWMEALLLIALPDQDQREAVVA